MGTLYLVATPIGNLEDITLRALRVLREVRVIAAEDTRHTRHLLNHFEITTPATSYHAHSGPSRLGAVLAELALGDVALVSDAGTPAISDPGEELVRAALAAGYPVVPVPGAAALIAALVASGLPTAQFTYLGFLPRRAAERRALLEGIRLGQRTLVLYEAPHRLTECLTALLTTLGDREAALARELTKLHEQWLRGPLSSLLARYASETPRGEYTIVVAGAVAAAEATPAQQADAQAAVEAEARVQLAALLASGSGTRAAATEVATTLGLPKRLTYELALRLSREAATDAADSEDA